MNQTMFEMLKGKQFILDEVIINNFGLHNEVLINDKIISLEVELSEFANEVRFFKYWSKKEMNRKKALFEYVDALHFFLSIANDLRVTINYDENIDQFGGGNVKAMYLRCKKHVIELYTSPSLETTFELAFAWFWSMGQKIGFTDLEILNAYNRKYEINHARQKNNY